MDYEKKLNDLVVAVTEEGGSDLHLTVDRPPVLRIVGSLIPLVKQEVLTAEDTKNFASLLLGDERMRQFLSKKEIDFSYTAPQGVRFRGNAFFQQGSIGIALRFIPAKIKTLEELNLPKTLSEIAHRKQGFFLVVGPVGHGKTTTLAAIIDIINKEQNKHIITIEDPIEYLFSRNKSIIDQREVGIDTESFREALRSMFRQDIDVVMIGEMRSPETISAAVTAAETGHLVFSTLHTNNAAQTIDRIIDSFPPDQQNQIRIQLAQALMGIFSQRLLPRVSGGLIPAYELMVRTSAVGNLIREGRTQELNMVIETGTSEGMIDMNRTLVDLIRHGEITAETARGYSLNPQALGNIH